MLFRRQCRKVVFLVAMLGCVLFGSCASHINTLKKIENPISVLIVDGHSNHNWQYTTTLTRFLLEQDGRFSVDVSTVPLSAEAASWEPNFAAYDVVIQNYNDARSPDAAAAWTESVRQALIDYVHNGGGLFVMHSGNNAFADWPEYRDIIGLGWSWNTDGYAMSVSPEGEPHIFSEGEGERTSHGKRYDTPVFRRGDHPIHANLPKTWMASSLEVYRYSRGPSLEGVEVLSYAMNNEHGDYWPIDWALEKGQGRVYNSTYGHVWRKDDKPVTFQCVAFQTMLIRSIQWLAGQPVDQFAPDDFPSANKVSLRGNLPSAFDSD